MAAGPPLHQSWSRAKCDAPQPDSLLLCSWATLNYTMPSLTTKAYDCLDCGRRYDVPLRFFETARGPTDRGCPSCGSRNRRRRRNLLSYLRDAYLSYSTS